MLNDYKPTHDPNLDTFKVQYLLGGSAVLAILVPYRYEFTEVSTISWLQCLFRHLDLYGLTPGIDAVGVFNMAGIGSHPPPAFHAPAYRRGRDDNNSLPFRAGNL